MNKISIIEGKESLNRCLLMMKYDLSKTLNENSISIYEQGSESRYETQYNKEFMKKYQPQPQSKPLPFGEFMEKVRDGVYSLSGIAVETFLTSVGAPEPVVGTYLVLLCYDIYKWVKEGTADWLNIIFDLLGFVSSGLFVAEIAPFVRGKNFSKITDALNYLKTTSLWKKILPYIKKIGSFLTTIMSKVGEAIKWIGENTKNNIIRNVGTDIINGIKTVWTTISKWIESGTTAVVKKAGVPQKVAQATGKTAKVAAQQGTIMGGIHSVATSQNKAEQEFTEKIVNAPDNY